MHLDCQNPASARTVGHICRDSPDFRNCPENRKRDHQNQDVASHNQERVAGIILILSLDLGIFVSSKQKVLLAARYK